MTLFAYVNSASVRNKHNERKKQQLRMCNFVFNTIATLVINIDVEMKCQQCVENTTDNLSNLISLRSTKEN